MCTTKEMGTKNNSLHFKFTGLILGLNFENLLEFIFIITQTFSVYKHALMRWDKFHV